MVNITIFIEGAQPQDATVATVDNCAVFREKFHKLFSQDMSFTEFNLKIEPFGSVTRARNLLEKIQNQNALLLIDLDAPKKKREERLETYKPLETSKLFFMIQEMEAWILSQPDKIEDFGRNEALIRKRASERITDNQLIKNKNYEDIVKPSEVLDTILRQYFDILKTRGGTEQRKGKRYLKTKDGPTLIGLLELKILRKDFDEVERMIFFIQKQRNNE